MFSVIDSSVFFAFLALSLIVGLYHALIPEFKKQTHSKTANFLTGGHKLPIFPVCLSLLTTFMSGLSLIALPAEIYLRGFSSGLSYLSSGFAFIVIAIFFIPVFYKLKFLNVYEYFEMRFDSVVLRRIGSLIFILSTTIYMAAVVYTPAIALAGITGVPFWQFVICVGVIGTIYTALGGIKAVIWTDTVQAFFLYLGLIVLIVKGTMEAGGFSNVFTVNEDNERLTKAMFRFNPTFLQYNSFWITQFGGIFHWISTYGLNQMSLQRYCSMPSLKDAKTVLVLTIPALFVVGLMTCYIGLLLGAYFNGCNPIALGEINNPDQMTILMASRVLSPIPGFAGIFVACLFSATLSTISSGINSLSAVVWEDFFKIKCQKYGDNVNEKIMKITTAFFGILCTILSLMCHNVGGIFLITMTMLGTLAGPLVGLFFLGIFFPKANRNGAMIGISASATLMLCCAIASNMQKPYRNYVLANETNTTSAGCINYTAGNKSEWNWRHEKSISYFKQHNSSLHYGNPNTLALARISPYSYAVIGMMITIFVGLLTSYIFPQKMSAERKQYSFACTYRGIDVAIPESKNKSENITLVKKITKNFILNEAKDGENVLLNGNDMQK